MSGKKKHHSRPHVDGYMSTAFKAAVRKTIEDNREEASKTICKLSLVALNDTEGLGYKRLTRFSLRLMELVDAYYEDEEVGKAHLIQRLQQIGYEVVQDGEIRAYLDADDQPVSVRKVKEHAGEQQE